MACIGLLEHVLCLVQMSGLNSPAGRFFMYDVDTLVPKAESGKEYPFSGFNISKLNNTVFDFADDK